MPTLDRTRRGQGVLREGPFSYTTVERRAQARYEANCVEQGREPDPHYLRNPHLRDLRHEATSQLAGRFAAHELAAITGHRSPRMLMWYYHADAAELARRLDPDQHTE